MVTPNRDAFASYLEETCDLRSRLLLASGIQHGWRPRIGREVEDVEAVLKRYFLAAQEALQAIDAQEVAKWLSGRETERAWSALFGRRSTSLPRVDPLPHEYAESIVRAASRPMTMDSLSLVTQEDRDGAELRLLELNSAEGIQRRIGRRLLNYCSHDWIALHRAIATAFVGYFYEDAYLKYSEKIETKAAIARKLLDAISLLQDERLLAACGIIRGPRISGPLHSQLQAIAASAGSIEPPLGRIDGTVRERALAYDLWLTFRRTFRANKTNAIYEFLLMDGVDKPPASLKQVQGWVKRWNDGNSNKYPSSLAVPPR